MSIELLFEAARIAVSGDPNDKRNFLLGCVGIRKDNAKIVSKNGAVISRTYENYRIISNAHAECRAIRKLGKRGTLYVSRVLKMNGALSMSRPCGGCRLRIKAAQVDKVWYTIDEFHYGIFDVASETDKIIEMPADFTSIRFGNFPCSSKDQQDFFNNVRPFQPPRRKDNRYIPFLTAH